MEDVCPLGDKMRTSIMNSMGFCGIGIVLGLNACALLELGPVPISTQNRASPSTQSSSPTVLFGCEPPKDYPRYLVRCLPLPKKEIPRSGIGIEIFDDDHLRMAGIHVRVRSLSADFPFDQTFITSDKATDDWTSLDLPIGLTVKVLNRQGDLTVSNLPEGTILEVTARKDGYLTRKSSTMIYNEIKFEPGYTSFSGGDTRAPTIVPPLSSKPEIDTTELIKQDKKLQGFFLHFSEPIERVSFENQFAIRAFQSYEYNGNNRVSFERRYTNRSGEPILEPGPVIFKKGDFNWVWNESGNEVTVKFPSGKTFPMDQRSTVDYELSLTALAASGELKDLTGEIRRERFFMLNNAFFEKAFTFRVDADPTGKPLLQEKEPYYWYYPAIPQKTIDG